MTFFTRTAVQTESLDIPCSWEKNPVSLNGNHRLPTHIKPLKFCILIVATALKTIMLKNKKCKYSAPALVHFHLPYNHRNKYADFENLNIFSVVVFIFFYETIVWYYKALEIFKKFSYCAFLSQILHSVREIRIGVISSKSVFYSGFMAF